MSAAIKASGFADLRTRLKDATPDALLTDPAQVAAIRALIAHRRKHNAEHAVYSHGDGLGHSMAYREHTWTLDGRRVSYHDGELRYLIDGVPVLKVHTVDNARQAAQLLAAIGVLPQRFIGGAL